MLTTIFQQILQVYAKLNKQHSKNISTEVLTMTEELRREPTGVVGRELRDELALSSSELRLSEPSLKPLLMELLSSQLPKHTERQRER